MVALIDGIRLCWLAFALIVDWMLRRHRISRYWFELRHRFYSPVWSAPLFWCGLRGRFRCEVSPNARKAETASILWFQRRYGWTRVGAVRAVVFLSLYLVLGVGLITLEAAAVLGLWDIRFPALHTIAGLEILDAGCFFLLVWLQGRRFVADAPYRRSRISAFAEIPQFGVLDTIGFAILGLAPVAFLVDLAFGGFPRLISTHPAPLWYGLFALFVYWLFSWWTQCAIWWFAHPRHGLLRLRCHIPLLLAARWCRQRGVHGECV